MNRCAFIKAGGERCKRTAKGSADYCYAHDPARAEERRRHATKAGRTGGNGRPRPAELRDIKGGIRFVIGGVLNARIGTAAGAVALQGFNALLRAVEVERRVYETEELEAKMEAIEDELNRRARFGA